jgi:peptidyl-prolyl cis-trans isomerase SurA
MNTEKILTALVLAGVLAAAAPAAPAQEVVEEIVAVVNDEVITLTDFRARYEMELAQIRSEQLPPDQYDQRLAGLKKGLLDQVITELLLLQKAKELGLNVQEQMKAMLEKIKTDNNFASDADLRRAVEQSGMPYEVWIKQYEEGTMRSGVLYTEVERSIVLEDAEVVQYYKKNPAEFTTPTLFKVQAIYLAGEGRTAEAVEQLKAAVDAKLKSGAAFADTAAELSDPPLKEAKGELGSFKAGELETTLEAPLERIKAGETAPWINNKNGWYLLKLVEKTDSFLRSFDESRKEVEEKLYNQRRAVKGEAYIKDLREKNFVKILNPDPLGFNK